MDNNHTTKDQPNTDLVELDEEWDDITNSYGYDIIKSLGKGSYGAVVQA